MSFRKRNVVVSSPKAPLGPCRSDARNPILAPGTRPSPLDGRLTTSTGTYSLDALLAGHAGLPLGTSLLLEESGTTDFGGTLLRYYAAEGIVQGHLVHVLGLNEAWGRELPGVAGATDRLGNVKAEATEKMKIAWRYERLGEFGRERPLAPSPTPISDDSFQQNPFCHEFDLTKHLLFSPPGLLNCVFQVPQMALDADSNDAPESIFQIFVHNLITRLSVTPKSTIHRIVIPNLLSPAIYPRSASLPEHILQFLHSLRALIRKHPTQVTAMITMPLALHPRETGLTRWIETLNDGVLELAPFRPNLQLRPLSNSKSTIIQEENPQGMLKVHRLPILHEKGGGIGGSSVFGDDLAFTLSRTKGLVIKPFSLPPVEGDSNEQHVALEGDSGKAARFEIEF